MSGPIFWMVHRNEYCEYKTSEVDEYTSGNTHFQIYLLLNILYEVLLTILHTQLLNF
jgi:hypothetical protein